MTYRKKTKTKRYKRKSLGVPKGYRHIWRYNGGVWNEKKVRPGLWKFSYRSSKGHKSKGMGSFGVGTKGAWIINAKQYITKTGQGKYNTLMIGTKKPLKFYVKKPRRR